MNILGISAFYYDSAAALVVDGDIVAAAQEERFTRRKHDSGFPRHAVDYRLQAAGIRASQLDYIAFYDKLAPEVRAPAGDAAGVRTERPAELSDGYSRVAAGEAADAAHDSRRVSGRADSTAALFLDHHESHAASAFFPSPYDEAAILTVDGVGEWTTASGKSGAGTR